jgi:hypothetical protein
MPPPSLTLRLAEIPPDVLDFADLALPESAPVDWNNRQIRSHLWHLAWVVASSHPDLLNWEAGRFLGFFCTDLAELGWALRLVLRREERDEWVWWILTSIAETAGLRPKNPHRDGYTAKLFPVNSLTPTSMEAFFKAHYQWPPRA